MNKGGVMLRNDALHTLATNVNAGQTSQPAVFSRSAETDPASAKQTTAEPLIAGRGHHTGSLILTCAGVGRPAESQLLLLPQAAPPMRLPPALFCPPSKPPTSSLPRKAHTPAELSLGGGSLTALSLCQCCVNAAASLSPMRLALP